ncbi:MAG: hypothetical protein GY865_02480, partial [candidate division Zixibacteria bacterium]|nr:hypothetical protein [candidate division Zixibacteria bacterium]
MIKLFSTIILISIAFVTSGANASDSFSINGYYKNFFAVYDFSDGIESNLFSDKPVGIVTNRLRIDSKLRLDNNIKLNVSYSIMPKIMDNYYSTTSMGIYSGYRQAYRFDDFDSRLYPKQSVQPTPISFAIYHNLDRCNISISMKKADIYIGRQAIAWGSARTINPTD